MTTLRQIITDAYRKSNTISVGETPESDQFDEGLRYLVSFIASVYGREVGELLTPINYGSENITSPHGKVLDRDTHIQSTYLPSNTRLIVNHEAASSIFLDPRPENGAMFQVIDMAGNLDTRNLTINGNGNHIEGASSLVLNTASLNKKWMYREDLNNWVAITDLTADSEMPFPTEFDEFFTISLAIRLKPSYGSALTNEEAMVLQRATSMLKTRYSQKRRVLPELALQKIHPHRHWGFYDDGYTYDDEFENGRTFL